MVNLVENFVEKKTFAEKNAHLKAIFLIILCTLFSSLGQILQKYGALKTELSSPMSFLLNAPLMLGFASYGIGAGLMIMAFKKGELSILYPILASSYVWVSLFSPLIFPADSMNLWKWGGVILIIISVGVLGSSVKNTKEKEPKEIAERVMFQNG